MSYTPHHMPGPTVVAEHLGAARAEIRRLRAEVETLRGLHADARTTVAALEEELEAAEQRVAALEEGLREIATTTKGYPNGSREGEIALRTLEAERDRSREERDFYDGLYREAEARAEAAERERDALCEGAQAALDKLRIGSTDDVFTILHRLRDGLDWRTGRPLGDGGAGQCLKPCPTPAAAPPASGAPVAGP